MNFIKRLLGFFYAFLMAGAGFLLILISRNMISAAQFEEMVNIVNSDVIYQVSAGCIGCIFVLLGVTAPFSLERRLKKNRIVSFQNPDGEVTVSLSAIEDYVKKIASGVPGIRDVRPRVEISGRGINITATVSISPEANIPEVTEKIQMEVRGKVQGMLGVEEKVNMKVFIRKILKGAVPAEGMAPESAPGMSRVPFREME
ncbi:MAG: alkaline shock response membrane anchor protein AmaP [Candidatus Omnitrophota bacterium]